MTNVLRVIAINFRWTGKQLQVDLHWSCITCDIWQYCMERKHMVDGIVSFFGSAGKTRHITSAFRSAGLSLTIVEHVQTTCPLSSPNTCYIHVLLERLRFQTTVCNILPLATGSGRKMAWHKHCSKSSSYTAVDLRRMTWSKFARREFSTRVSSSGWDPNNWNKNESFCRKCILSMVCIEMLLSEGKKMIKTKQT